MMIGALDAPRRQVAEIDYALLWSVLILLFSLAALAFALAQAARLREPVSDGYAYLLWLVVCAGTWFLTDTDIVTVANMGSEAYLYLNVGSYIMMPVPFSISTVTSVRIGTLKPKRGTCASLPCRSV